jgi:hypothetical protein
VWVAALRTFGSAYDHVEVEVLQPIERQRRVAGQDDLIWARSAPEHFKQVLAAARCRSPPSQIGHLVGALEHGYHVVKTTSRSVQRI